MQTTKDLCDSVGCPCGPALSQAIMATFGRISNTKLSELISQQTGYKASTVRRVLQSIEHNHNGLPNFTTALLPAIRDVLAGKTAEMLLQPVSAWADKAGIESGDALAKRLKASNITLGLLATRLVKQQNDTTVAEVRQSATYWQSVLRSLIATPDSQGDVLWQVKLAEVKRAVAFLEALHKINPEP